MKTMACVLIDTGVRIGVGETGTVEVDAAGPLDKYLRGTNGALYKLDGFSGTGTEGFYVYSRVR